MLKSLKAVIKAAVGHQNGRKTQENALLHFFKIK